MKLISEDAFAAYRRGLIDRGQFIEHLLRDGGRGKLLREVSPHREKISVGTYLPPCFPDESMDNEGEEERGISHPGSSL